MSGRLCLCFSMTIWLVVALSGQLPFYFGVIYIKRWGNLITSTSVSHSFCVQAIREASRRKRDRRIVQKILSDIDNYANDLRYMILNNTFEPKPYSYECRIEYGKYRKLQKPAFFPDQCIHHALIMLIRDKLVKRIDPYACASINNRGSKMAISKCKYWIQKKAKRRTSTKYIIKCDIHKCFDSIKPAVVMSMWQRIIKDKQWLNLTRKVVFSCESLPLGNYMSAFTLNIMLKSLDETIRANKTVSHYIRYMDDFVIFVRNKRKAKAIKAIILGELSKLGLRLKSNYQMFALSDRGLDFVGYRFFRKYTILRKRNHFKLLRQARRMSLRSHWGVKSCQSIMSRLGLCTHCHSKYQYKVVGNLININAVKEIIRRWSKYGLQLESAC